MIGYIRGIVTHLFVDYCFIDVQGVGYRIFIAESTRQKLMIGMEVSLFTYLNVREDALLLYGFFTQDEYELFLMLTSVTGIGPKGAIGVLSAISPETFRSAVRNKSVSVLTKIPGIGKKTAERIILELYDKIGGAAESDKLDNDAITIADSNDEIVTQAMLALTALGYTQTEIMPVLGKLAHVRSVEELIKMALREFGRR